MKNVTKTILGIIALSLSLMSFSACQEDVYPDLQQPQQVAKTDVIEDKSETEDEEEDLGMNPK